MPRRPRSLALGLAMLLVVLALSLAGGAAEAQTSRIDNSGTGRVHGRVSDAETLEPLPGVVVQLEPVAPEAPPAGRTAAAPRSMITDSAGDYLFDRIAPGRYRLRVERIGYFPRVIDVELLPGDEAHIGFRLEFQPVRLPALEIIGSAPQSFAASRGTEDGLVTARVEVSRRRQQRFLSADVRMMTEADVVEAVTLGEPDLFRALQRTPGVTTRDDYTATLWTRGASWDQTRVFLDGMPLYNPTHAGWLFSAVNPDGLGAVSFFPGHRSARWSDGTAAVLDLRSKAGGERGDFAGVAELSPASVRLQLDGRELDDRFRWMIAGRRTHVDLLSRITASVTGRDDLEVPYDFSDLLGRVDGDLGGGRSLELSGIVEHDNLRGDVPGLLKDNTGQWGNVSGSVSLRLPVPAWSLALPGPLPDLGLGRAQARLTAGATSFATRVETDGGEIGALASAVTLPPIENLILHRRLELGVTPADGDPDRWAFGAQLVWDTVSYTGINLLVGLTVPPEFRDDLVPTKIGAELAYGALWAERRYRPTERISVDVGLRTEIGDSVYNGGYVRWAPRLAGRYALGAATFASASWSRTYQYTQDVAPAAGPIGPQLHLSALWVLSQASSARPAARADVTTLGIERWLGPAWLLGASAYQRYTTGLKIPNPETGRVTLVRNPEGVGTNEARGIDLSARKLAGRWTGSLSYSLGESAVETSAEEDGQPVTVRYPASADVRHALDLTGITRIGERWRVGGAFTYGSGIPFTRLVLPDSGAPSPDLDPDLGTLERPNAERTTAYASLDLMLDYSRPVRSWKLSVYAQLRNALNRDNAVTYLGSRRCGSAIRAASLLARDVDCEGVAGGVKDSFEAGLPRLPLVGVRLQF